MTFATFGSLHLFVEEPSNSDWQDNAVSQDAEVAGRVDYSLPAQPELITPAPEPITISVTIDRSAPIHSYLKDAGLALDDARRWLLLIQRAAGVTDFQQGHTLTLYKDPGTGDLRGLKYNLNDRVAVSELNYGAGIIRASPELIKYVFRPVAVSFRLTGNFWREARRHGLPPIVLATLDYAFKDNHPLELLPRGSDIKLIYQEKVSRYDNSRYVTGLQAAQLQFGSKTLTAVAFRDENGHSRLYDLNGHALGTEALPYPLAFQYISSGFDLYRYHPILHQYRPHVGVDLVARYGTPVKAVADGRVETAGWCGELGRCVRILHDGGIVSIYGHLSEIEPELHDGAEVQVGQIIGKVGSSGLSTGPHLHYGLEKDGRYVNPLTASIGANHQVSPRMRALFDHFKSEYMAIFERLPALGTHQLVSRTLPSISGSSTPGVTVIADRGTQAPDHRWP
ncbi:MAG: M23 family metallopeptidase, partial [Deltaproteobacteria bacterium]|nr:M23 family metallopeptidase [Deltaproteobacteria bacterium]